MKALLVDGEELFRLSMREVISVSADFNEIIEVSNQADFLAKTASHDDFNLIVVHPSTLDNNTVNLSDGQNPCLNLLKRLYPKAALVVISDRDTPIPHTWTGHTTVCRSASVSSIVLKTRQAMKLSTEGYIGQPAKVSSPRLQHAAMSALNRGHDSNTLPSKQAYMDMSRLSYRQRQILEMAAGGLPNKEIAARLAIAEGTVKAHMHAIFKVLDVTNRTQAVLKFGAVTMESNTKENFSPHAARF